MSRMEPAVFLDAVQGRRICVALPRLHTPVEISLETALAVWDACGGKVKVQLRGSLAKVMAHPPDNRYVTGRYRGPDPVRVREAT